MKRGTKKLEGKARWWKVRVSEKEDNRARLLAKLYAGGNLSKWLRHAALNAERKHLK